VAYDPASDGADCAHCALRERRQGAPVPALLRPRALFTVIGEAPDVHDVERGEPFVSPGGALLDGVLAGFGVYRDSVSYTTALSCMPLKGKLAPILKEITEANKVRRKAKAPLLLTPMECCAPRLAHDLEGATRLVPLGKLAVQATLGADVTISDARGNPVELGERRIVPTWHPAFILHKPSERFAFEADLGRAVRWFRTGQTGWVPAQVQHQPTIAELRAWWRATQGRQVTFDIETLKWKGRPDDRYDALTDVLAMVGLYNKVTGGVVIQLLSNDGVTELYSHDEARAIRVQIAQILVDPCTPKTSWNGGYYDRIVLEHELHVVPTPHLDGILVHRAVQSELSHRLGYVASIWTDAPAWKSAHAKRDAETDEEWRTYNGVDLVATDRAIEQLRERAKARDQALPIRVHHKVQRMCVGLHQMGMLVHEPTRAKLDAEQRTIAVGALRVIREAIGIPDFNPQSVPQLKELLFETWDLPVLPRHRTKSGDPSTDDDTIRALASGVRAKRISGTGISPVALDAFFAGLRRFRKSTKMRGTYLRKLIPWDKLIPYDDLSEDAEDEELVAAAGENEAVKERVKVARGRSKRWGILDPRDGRAHCDFNVHGPATQRISSSNFNAQNVPGQLRCIFVPGPGHRFVYADASQLELRLAAALWNLELYIDAFNTPGADPHAVTSETIFGDVFRAADKDNRKKLRDFAKRFQYASQYGAETGTIFEVISSAEDRKGNLIFPNATLAQIEEASAKWTKGIPQLVIGWDAVVAEYQRDGFLREPVLGWRRDFLNTGGDAKDTRNEMLNFQCQSAGAAIVHLASSKLLEGPLPFNIDQRTGMVNQCHDAFTFEQICDCSPVEDDEGHEKHAASCPCTHAAHAIEEAMHQRPTACWTTCSLKKGQIFPVEFKAEAKIVKTWC
jgi:uracil-DNA glycosylase family 4